MSLATRHGTAEYAAQCDDTAAALGEPCVVAVDRAYYTITAPECVFRAADRELAAICGVDCFGNR